MGAKRLPYGKIGTNELVLELNLIAYNILSMLKQKTVNQGKTTAQRIVSGKRIRTVIQNIIHFAIHATMHTRKLLLSISKSNARDYNFIGLTGSFAFRLDTRIRVI